MKGKIMIKRIAIIICAIIISTALCVSAYATGVSDSEQWEVKHTFTPINSLQTTMKVMYTTTSGQADEYLTFTEAIDNSYMYYPSTETISYSSFRNTLLQARPNIPDTSNFSLQLDNWNVIYTDSTNLFTYNKTISENLPTHNNSTLDYNFNLIGEHETIYINKAELNKILINPNIQDIIGETTLNYEYRNMTISFLSETTNDEHPEYGSKFEVITMSSDENETDITTWIDEIFSLNSQYGDIIGISNYNIKQGYTMSYANETQYTGQLKFPLYRTSNYQEYDAGDFLSQTPFGNSINGIEIIEIGGGGNGEPVEFDIASIIEGVKNALAVDLFGVISILDILTIIVAISITIWFLKVFAGG